MGIHRENGYSASVEGFFVVGGERLRLAKTNGSTFVLTESVELVPGTTGDLLVIVDDQEHSRMIVVPEGVAAGQTVIKYSVVAPF